MAVAIQSDLGIVWPAFMHDSAFLDIVQSNDNVRRILDGLLDLALPDCWLVAGCLFQSVWNHKSGRPPDENISDYDIFYFDAGDLGWDAEDAIIQRVGAHFADLPVRVELRNQARVHLWYEQRFGRPYPRLANAADGIRRFLIAGTCIGISVGSGSPVLHAPHGLQDMMDGVLRPNPLTPYPELYAAKAASYRARWPWLRDVSDPAQSADRVVAAAVAHSSGTVT
jgi:uncharacterized protein